MLEQLQELEMLVIERGSYQYCLRLLSYGILVTIYQHIEGGYAACGRWMVSTGDVSRDYQQCMKKIYEAA